MIKTLTLHQASKYLRDKGLSLCSDTLADGLEQGVYPFGVCIRTCLLYTSDAADE